MLKRPKEFIKPGKGRLRLVLKRLSYIGKRFGDLDCNQMLKTFKKLLEQRQENRNWQSYILYKYERSVKIIN